MPGENIQDWSTTAVDNGSADTLINWAEGQPRASVNNSARSMMAAHAKNRNLLNGSIVTSGTANAQTFISGVTYTTVPTGLRVLLKIGVGLSNTGPTTLNMDGIADAPVKDIYGSALIGGELRAGCYHEFIYDGTVWILLIGRPVVTPLAAQEVSGAGAVDFTGLFTGDYTHYIFDIIYTISADGAALYGYVSSNNGVSFLQGIYSIAFSFVCLNIPGGFNNAVASQNNLQVGPTLPTHGYSQYTIMDLMVGGYQNFRSFGYSNTIGNYHFTGSGLPEGGIVVNAFRFTPNAGTVSGTFKLYGMRV